MSLNWKLHASTWLNHQPEILAPLPQKKVWNLIPSLFNTGQSRQPNEVCRWQQTQAWLGFLNSIGLSWACFCIYSLIPNIPLKELNEMTHRVIFHPHPPFQFGSKRVTAAPCLLKLHAEPRTQCLLFYIRRGLHKFWQILNKHGRWSTNRPGVQQRAFPSVVSPASWNAIPAPGLICHDHPNCRFTKSQQFSWRSTSWLSLSLFFLLASPYSAP